MFFSLLLFPLLTDPDFSSLCPCLWSLTTPSPLGCTSVDCHGIGVGPCELITARLMRMEEVGCGRITEPLNRSHIPGSTPPPPVPMVSQQDVTFLDRGNTTTPQGPPQQTDSAVWGICEDTKSGRRRTPSELSSKATPRDYARPGVPPPPTATIGRRQDGTTLEHSNIATPQGLPMHLCLWRSEADAGRPPKYSAFPGKPPPQPIPTGWRKYGTSTEC